MPPAPKIVSNFVVQSCLHTLCNDFLLSSLGARVSVPLIILLTFRPKEDTHVSILPFEDGNLCAHHHMPEDEVRGPKSGSPTLYQTERFGKGSGYARL